jgi:hypothetical protein
MKLNTQLNLQKEKQVRFRQKLILFPSRNLSNLFDSILEKKIPKTTR